MNGIPEPPLFDRTTGEDHRTAAPLLNELRRRLTTPQAAGGETP